MCPFTRIQSTRSLLGIVASCLDAKITSGKGAGCLALFAKSTINTRRESCRCDVFSLHRFPSATKNDKLRHRWIAAVNRKNYQPSENARVCSEHFLDKPTEQNPAPVLRLGYNKKVVKGRRLLIRQSNDLTSWLPNAANPVVTMTNKTKLKVQRTMFCVL
nr:uncharacterized protein LOC129384699 [Dermacentor andersoni]